MSYLHKIKYQDQPLLENVKTISTVSGGTISGVVYALQKQNNPDTPFEDIYSLIIQKLKTLDLIKEGLEKLNPDGSWNNPHKKNKNLINAFAELYDYHFTGGATFGVFDNVTGSHLESVVFNATEFNNGMAFRFQNQGLFGNWHLRAKDVEKNEVKLSDIIAASSCFPGGFEPIMWPEDFLHKESSNLEKKSDHDNQTGLMDGGIADNQGIESVLLSEKRVNTDPHDLIIVTDVTSPYMNNYKDAEEKTGHWRNWTGKKIMDKYQSKLSFIKKLLLILTGIFLLGPFLAGYENNVLTGIGISLGFVSLILCFLVDKLDTLVSNLIKGGKVYLKNVLPDFYYDKLGNLDVGDLSLGRIEPLVLNRVTSLTSLLMNVFLKTVRRLVYTRLYADGQYEYRRVANLIKEMTEEDYNYKLSINRKNEGYYQNLPGCDPDLKGDYQKVIGTELKKVAEEAASFGTTLWFTDKDKVEGMLDKLVATGQFSMCYNLLVYLTELRCTPDNGYEELSAEVKKAIQEVWDQCMTDWKKFKGDPMFLVNHLNKKLA
jgi:predicted acylesterase/phospholipase RssA